MGKYVVSTGFKLITLISVAVGGYSSIAILSMSRTHLDLPLVMIIPAVLAGLVLMIAGLAALISIKVGLYVYTASCLLWLIGFTPMLWSKSEFINRLPQLLRATVTAVFGIGGFPFWLSLFGLIISCYEMKRKRRMLVEYTND